MALAALAAAPAYAQQSPLGRSGMENVFVWRDRAAYNEGIALIRDGSAEKNPALVFNRLACYPKNGTRATLADRSGGLVKVIITEGNDAGCQGFVAQEDLP